MELTGSQHAPLGNLDSLLQTFPVVFSSKGLTAAVSEDVSSGTSTGRVSQLLTDSKGALNTCLEDVTLPKESIHIQELNSGNQGKGGLKMENRRGAAGVDPDHPAEPPFDSLTAEYVRFSFVQRDKRGGAPGQGEFSLMTTPSFEARRRFDAAGLCCRPESSITELPLPSPKPPSSFCAAKKKTRSAEATENNPISSLSRAADRPACTQRSLSTLWRWPRAAADHISIMAAPLSSRRRSHYPQQSARALRRVKCCQCSTLHPFSSARRSLCGG
ncbi:unnamed protein product [Pleuronectes platessa]|uniref:Uncharacterized protein n=1 Tax=Pleuronectes platessa TaxID=8262 RepID=A0A9N7Z8F7_PLEPL|nr:unnamed protein product [Pleuronectes platessa]